MPDTRYANEVRLRRQALLRRFRSGEVGFAEVLADPTVQRMHLQRLLEYAPTRAWDGVGTLPHNAKKFAWSAVAEVGCGPWREVGMLTDRQRETCISAVCGSLREQPGSGTMPEAPEPPGRLVTGSHATWSHDS